jgi:5-methylthioadenosine/S-adenosylhomocysteine deaminase
MRADCLVRGEYLLTMDAEGRLLRDGALAVKDGKIARVGPFSELRKAFETEEVLGGEGMAVMPGLINAHTHAAMVFMRGMADDLPLREWLEGHIWPAEGRWLSPEFVRDAVELAALEMLLAGVTTFHDMYFFEEEAARVARRMGIRAVLGAGVVDFPTRTTSGADDCLRKAEALIEALKGDGLVTPAVAPHSAYACSAETLKKVRDLSMRHGVLVHIHVSETEWEVAEMMSKHGRRPVEYLEGLGFLGRNVLAAHAVWVSEGEIELMVRKGVGVAHCPESNLKLASGVAPVPRMLHAGLTVALGTDGAASNNDLSILGEVSTASRLHKAMAKDPTALGCRTALLMATRWGAEALGLTQVGSLEPGKVADLIILDLRKPHLTPLYDVCSHLVYSARPSDVDTVMVDGSVLVRGGRLVHGDQEEILAKARSWGERIRAENAAPPSL